jgi:hypothetical protein
MKDFQGFLISNFNSRILKDLQGGVVNGIQLVSGVGRQAIACGGADAASNYSPHGNLLIIVFTSNYVIELIFRYFEQHLFCKYGQIVKQKNDFHGYQYLLRIRHFSNSVNST